MSRVDDKEDKQISGAEALSMLQTACDERTRAKVIYSDDLLPFYSSLVHLYSRHILMDGIDPESALAELSENMKVEVCFSLGKRGFFCFETIYLGLKGTVGSQYLIELPETLTLVQRRRSYRVEPYRTLPAECLAIGHAAIKIKVVVENVSIEGACLSFPRTANIRVGARIQGIRLRLNDRDLILDCIVRSTFRNEAGRFCLGVQWEVIDNEQLQALQEYIACCQRVEAKKRR